MHPFLTTSDVPDQAAVRVLVGVIAADHAAGDSHAGADFAAPVELVSVMPAAQVVAALDEIDGNAEDLIVRVTGDDPADVIAGQTLAIAHGVRALVADDVQAARRVAVMMSQVLNA